MTTAIFDDLTTLSDATRSRLLLLLERHELTVSELCTVLQRSSSPQQHNAPTANALSPAVDARILGSAATGAPSAGTDHAGAFILN